ncbi:MAG: hypothetical protein JSS72_00375 [Armatimonadetes bacterium]|nr:hypothetical protein [Armatimonadota bacterium]
MQLPVAPRALVELTGEDRLVWLQGQVTQDLRGMASGEVRQAMLCNPTGQILALLSILFEPSRLLISLEAATKKYLLARVEEMVILEDVAARDLSGELSCQVVNEAVEAGICFPWPDGYVEVWSPQPLESQPIHPSYEAWRIAHAVPVYGADYNEKVLGAELGPYWDGKAISYAKGCYTGQEVLMRIHSRGHTNRRWTGLRAETELATGAVITLDGQEVGRITSSAHDEVHGFLAAGLIRNSAEAGSTVEVDGVKAVVFEPPL